jgi:glucans biosynthesis protein
MMKPTDGSQDALCCGAKGRNGKPCERPREPGRRRCHVHGGAPGSGAPRGKRNGRYVHGRFTAEGIEERQALRQLLR